MMDGELWGVWCERHASSQFGASSGWGRDLDGNMWTGTKAEAKARADKWNESKGFARVSYRARRFKHVSQK